jgi:hypothetical protein
MPEGEVRIDFRQFRGGLVKDSLAIFREVEKVALILSEPGLRSFDGRLWEPPFRRSPGSERRRCVGRAQTRSDYRQRPVYRSMWMFREDSSDRSRATPKEGSRSPGMTTAQVRFSRNSWFRISQSSNVGETASPIWMTDQWRARRSAVGSSGRGPRRMKWLLPWTRMPTIVAGRF